MQQLKTGLKAILLGIYLLAVSALLMMAARQAFRLARLYRASPPQDPAADLGWLAGPGIEIWGYPLAAVFLAAGLFLAVWRHPRRLLAGSLLALLAFGALNLYSGHHLLPVVLVPPRPSALLENYAQALAAGDLEAALRLTDQSQECTEAMMEAYPEHRLLLEERLGPGWEGAGIHSSPHRSIMTYYEDPVPRKGILQPVPTQLFRLLVRTERGNWPGWRASSCATNPSWEPATSVARARTQRAGGFDESHASATTLG